MATARRGGHMSAHEIEPEWEDTLDLALSPHLWLLIPSFLLGSQTWCGVARVLERLGQRTVVPSPVRTTPRDEDHITPWLEGVIAALPAGNHLPIVVVGHSAACPREPLVVDRLLTDGHQVSSMILVNGRFPEDGSVPTERDSPFMDTLDALVRPDGHLPPWHRWWGSMISDMLPDDEARKRVLSDAKPVPRAIFDQPIPAPKLPAEVGHAFLALGDMYKPSFDRARKEGWEVSRIDGEHLHMVVDPIIVAGALLSLAGRSSRRS